MSDERNVQLQEAASAADPLRRLRLEFNRELAVLQSAGAADRLREVFASDPRDIADAANVASEDDA